MFHLSSKMVWEGIIAFTATREAVKMFRLHFLGVPVSSVFINSQSYIHYQWLQLYNKVATVMQNLLKKKCVSFVCVCVGGLLLKLANGRKTSDSKAFWEM